ncbi:MAG: hypothetical protein CO080_09205 [Nitrospirae bacterium CG_4_9_14_0_8_um_filter_70_14]|nr:MAG: hypothetical protein CO080_09205 [Nitrospirae bacterium CG_4_9_14_0_8_um_filter_70_14]
MRAPPGVGRLGSRAVAQRRPRCGSGSALDGSWPTMRCARFATRGGAGFAGRRSPKFDCLRGAARWLLVALLLRVAGGAVAHGQPLGGADAAPARIIAIEFVGNHRTKQPVLVREMLVTVGQPFDAHQFEDSLQRLRNLGLFFRVSGEVQPAGPGQVVLTVRVVEKWAVLPLPQVDLTEEGDVKLGLDYTDYNFRGQDQRLNLKFKHALGTDTGGKAGESASIAYDVPQVGESPYDVSTGVGLATHNEAAARTALTGTRGGNATSVDFDLDVGRFERVKTWRRRSALGLTVNHITASEDQPRWLNSLRLSRSVDAVDDFVYTFRGFRAGGGVQLFSDWFGSEVSAAKITGEYTRFWKRDEHNVVGKVSGGYTFGVGARDVGFELGGGNLRGIDKASLRGAGMWLANLEYRSPRAWRWLGGACFTDLGVAGEEADLVDPSHLAAGGGVGVRATIGRLVKGVARLDVAYGTGPDGVGSLKVYFGLKQPL